MKSDPGRYAFAVTVSSIQGGDAGSGVRFAGVGLRLAAIFISGSSEDLKAPFDRSCRGRLRVETHLVRGKVSVEEGLTMR